MHTIRWGIIGCGDVTEVKSGPGFQNADGSALVAVMRRDRDKARDYARRHGVARAYDRADDLIQDVEVDAVYIATPPSSHRELAFRVAAAGKPCLVEKPMALNHAECLRMIEAFQSRGLPLWVAYYRRALRRFEVVRDRLRDGAIGQVSSVHVQVSAPLLTGARSNELAHRSGHQRGWAVFRSRFALLRSAGFSRRPNHPRRRTFHQYRRRYPGRGCDRRGLRVREWIAGHGSVELQRVGEDRCHDIHRLRWGADHPDLQRHRRHRETRRRDDTKKCATLRTYISHSFKRSSMNFTAMGPVLQPLIVPHERHGYWMSVWRIITGGVESCGQLSLSRCTSPWLDVEDPKVRAAVGTFQRDSERHSQAKQLLRIPVQQLPLDRLARRQPSDRRDRLRALALLARAIVIAAVAAEDAACPGDARGSRA